MNLFGEENLVKKEFPQIDEWPERVKLEYERSSIGFYLSGHPLLEYSEIIPLRFNSTSEISEWQDSQSVKLAGAIMSIKRRRTQKGDLWASVEISDLDGIVNVLVFPNVYAESMELLTEGNVVVIEGTVREEDDKKIIARKIERLDSNVGLKINSILIKLNPNSIDEEFLKSLKQFLKRNGTDKGKPVIIEAEINGYVIRMQAHPDYNVEVDPAVIRELKKIVGNEKVSVL